MVVIKCRIAFKFRIFIPINVLFAFIVYLLRVDILFIPNIANETCLRVRLEMSDIYENP